MWNYGKEVWCNLKGQYVTIVVDLSAGGTDISICSLGIMGTEYVRAGVIPLQTAITVDFMDSITIDFENIMASSAL